MEKKNRESRREFLKACAAPTGAVLVSGMFSPALSMGGRGRRRWGFLIDLDRCTGCKSCAVACKTEFNVPLGVFRSSVKEFETGKLPKATRSFLPWLCNHCRKPVCLEDCPVDETDAEFTWPDGTVEKYRKRATYQRPDGIVLVDQDRCVGCGACVEACPYRVRFLNPARKTVSPDAVGDNPAEKCDLCVHRLDAGIVPSCVNTCPSRARVVGDLEDPESEINKIIRAKKKRINVLLPTKGTDPQCRYVSLNPLTYEKGRDTK